MKGPRPRPTSSFPGRRQGSSAVLAHLRRVVHAIRRKSAQIEASIGLTGPELWALREIDASVLGLALGELARRLVLHKAGAGRIADRLLKKGLVQAERPANDRRFVVVRVTPRGRALARKPVGDPAQASLLSRLGDLSPEEIGRIESALARLVELLEAESIEPDPLFDDRPAAKRRGAARPRKETVRKKRRRRAP